MPRQLTITPAPFKSSYLAIPPTPFSPLLPLTPPASPPKHNSSLERAARLKATADLLPPPTEPLHWLWQCHRCNRVYQLGVTRRCLDDGHFFCAGSTVVKRSRKNGYKKVVRHQACASEFDYQGWKAWGTWRRGVADQVEAAEMMLRVEEGLGIELPVVPEEGQWFGGAWTRKAVGSSSRNYWEKEKSVVRTKDCWNHCDYPSECRWGKQFGVKTPTMPSVPASVVPSSTTQTKGEELPLVQEEEEDSKPKTSFDDILLSITDPDSPDFLEPLSSSTAHPDPAATTTSLEPDTAAPSMNDLLQFAKRRKRRSSGQIPLVPSPLGANPPSPEEEEEQPKRPGLRKCASSSALEVFEGEVRKGSGFEGLGELREKADAFVQSFRAARSKLQGGGRM